MREPRTDGVTDLCVVRIEKWGFHYYVPIMLGTWDGPHDMLRMLCLRLLLAYSINNWFTERPIILKSFIKHQV